MSVYVSYLIFFVSVKSAFATVSLFSVVIIVRFSLTATAALRLPLVSCEYSVVVSSHCACVCAYVYCYDDVDHDKNHDNYDIDREFLSYKIRDSDFQSL